MRVIYKDNTVKTDISKKISDYKSGSHTFSYVTGEDAFYIGSDLPFNSIYIKLGGTVNAISTTMTIEYWDSRNWQEMAEVIDDTIGISQSAHVMFTPDRQSKWVAESTNDSGSSIPELSDFKIYDQYWIKVTFDATLTASVVLNWIGPLFSNDSDLYAEYPIFNSSALKTAFESGKTTWEEQHVRATDILIKDLIAKNVIKGFENILRIEDFKLAAVSKCAQLIFTSLGDDYVDDAQAAKTEYKERISSTQYPVDLNDDGFLDKNEKFAKVGFMSR